MGFGISVLNRLPVSGREESSPLRRRPGQRLATLEPRIGVRRHRHARISLGRQRITNLRICGVEERRVIRVAAVLNPVLAETPEIDKFPPGGVDSGFELGNARIALAQERLRRYLGILDQQVETGGDARTAGGGGAIGYA